MGKKPHFAHEEDDVRLPILEVLAQGGSWTTQELTKAVRVRLLLTPVDLEQAAKRWNEQKIDQIIANALQEKRKLCAASLIERIDAGVFRLTPAGTEFLKKHNEDVAWGVRWLTENHPDLEDD
jgi:hypothetical protein